MYEFEIINKITDEERIIWGYSYKNACERSKLDPANWIVLCSEYID